MSGQLKITIADKEWLVSLANTPWEEVQGLGGITGIAPGTGMLFDLGYEQTIQVTTVPMLFALDIAFFSGALEITEIYHNVAPGYLVNSTIPARYFLEVNACELNGLTAGLPATLEVLALQTIATGSDWVSPMMAMIGFLLLGAMLIGLANSITPDTPVESQKLSYLPEVKRRKPASLPDQLAGLPVARLVEKWQKTKARNSALAFKDLETLGPDYDTADCKQALTDYQAIQRADYSDPGEYQEARDEAWETFIECLESLAGEEEEMVSTEKQLPAMIPAKKPSEKENGLNYLVDSPEYLTQTIEDIGYRNKIDQAFLNAIARARGSR